MLSETKRQVINLQNFCIWLVNLFELYDDAQTCQCQKLTDIMKTFSSKSLAKLDLQHLQGKTWGGTQGINA